MDKEALKREAKQKIDDVFTKIEELEAKKDQFSSEMRDDYEQRIAQLRSKRDDLMAKYEELQQASESKVAEVKSAFDSAAKSFEEGFSKIASIFKK